MKNNKINNYANEYMGLNNGNVNHQQKTNNSKISLANTTAILTFC